MAMSFVALLTNGGVLPNRCCVIPNGTLTGTLIIYINYNNYAIDGGGVKRRNE